jgi:hypothetical protein
MFNLTTASALPTLGSPARKVRIIIASLALAVGLAAPLADGVEAHGTATSGTYAYCGTYTVSAMAGTAYRYISGNFPKGATNGATYIAGRLQTRLYYNGEITGNFGWVTWANGSKWARTTVARFPYGQFAIGSTWYRRATINFNEHWLNQSLQARIVWRIAWPDGHQTTASTQWATCF